MDAETAADASGAINDAPDRVKEQGSDATSPQAEKQTGEKSEVRSEKSASEARVSAILKEEGLSEEARDSVQSTEEGKQSDDSSEEEIQSEVSGEGAGSAGVPEGKAGDGAGSEGDEGKGVESAEEAEEALTEEEQKTADPKLMARIHKLTAKRETLKESLTTAESRATQAEEEREQLREQLKNASPVQLAPTPLSPLADVTDGRGLAQVKNTYEELLKWATLNPDGATDVVQQDPSGQPLKDAEGNVTKRDYSAQEMAEIRYEADRVLREEVPNRYAYIQARSEQDKIARELYPQMFKEGTDENKAFREFRQMLPELERFVDPDLTVARYLGGLKAELAKQDAKGKIGKPVSEGLKPFLEKRAKSAPSVPVIRTGGGNGTDRTQGSTMEINKAEERVLEGGGEEAEVDLVGALRSSQSPDKRGALV